jgi:hypothetical protein
MTVLITTRHRPSPAAVLGAIMVLLAAALIALSFLARRPGYPLQPLMIALPSAAVGVLVARRQPRNPNGWLLLGITAAILLSTGAGVYSLLVYRAGRNLPLGPLGLVLYQLWSPALGLFLLVILLFPDGHLPSPRWRWVVWAYCLLCGGYLALLIGVAADAIGGHQIRVDDAYGGLTVIDYPVGRFAVAQDVILVLILAFGLCFAGRQLLSWRRSSGDRRQQLKWLMFGSAICVICAGLSIPGQTASSGIWAMLNNVLSLGFIALPASIGVGILRYTVRDRPGDLQDAGVRNRHGAAARRVFGAGDHGALRGLVHVAAGSRRGDSSSRGFIQPAAPPGAAAGRQEFQSAPL